MEFVSNVCIRDVSQRVVAAPDPRAGTAGSPGLADGARRPVRPTGVTTLRTTRHRRQGVAALVLLGLGATGFAPAAVAAGKPAVPSHNVTRGPRLVVSSPANNGALSSFSSPLVLRFDANISPSSPRPEISPGVAGSWTESTGALIFTPGPAGWPSYQHLTVTVAGLRTTSGATVARARLAIRTGAPSTLRFQQLLATLGYLPLSFTPAASPSGNAGAHGTAPGTRAYVTASPQPGHFAWRWPATPTSLASSWSTGKANLVTEGAIMAFEAMHNLPMDGVAGPAVWSALHQAALSGTRDPRPYDYITVREQQPETLTVWQNGANVYTSLTNTGIAGATTQTGTFPVYLRYLTTTMVGTMPNGVHYDDAGIPWVAYFNGGDAIHGFVRASYGWPQSNGCVELPPANAAHVWPMDYFGTLVHVS